MTHLERILAIYNLLKQNPHRMDQLINFPPEGGPRSRTQVYRDLKEVGELAATHQEKLTQISVGRYNGKIWKVEPVETQESLKSYDLDTYFIMRLVLPGVFAECRTQSLNRLQDSLAKRVISSPAVKYKSGISDQTFISSHFYENKVTKELDIKLTKLLEVIGQQQTIKITGLSGDSTAVKDTFSLGTCVWAIKIIFHRGCFYLATVRTDDFCVLVFQIDHIVWEIHESIKAQKNLQKIVEDNLKIRFGVTQNYDEQPHTVKLLFSDTTGKFISEQKWHHSQQVTVEPESNGKVNYRLTFNCGINRELVGWLFQWMSNVKVLGPQKLIDLYNEQLRLMTEIAAQPAETPLAYRNEFAPQAAPASDPIATAFPGEGSFE